MKNILILFSFFFILSAFTHPISAAEIIGPGGNHYFTNKNVECSAGAKCFGINSTMSCDTGAVCTNYGPQQPSCNVTSSGGCSRHDLPDPLCTWKNEKISCPTKPLTPPLAKAPLLPLQKNTPPPGPYQQNGTCVNIRFDGKILRADCKLGAGASNPADRNNLIPNELNVSRCSAGSVIINCKGNLRCSPCN